MCYHFDDTYNKVHLVMYMYKPYFSANPDVFDLFCSI